ncbi:hypothetical protein C8A00DRAFT_11900 [Chaetomidium leptoderma]|uniref:Uncharacterized protein n=1 Tax=Chaetomidium leptoderma TaxID=669021 RepID=A0AAN6VSZ3_9PEZI|nr:hypothetical protein C8A00DRAFT_11900 [Chaetomidium leptoderma]
MASASFAARPGAPVSYTTQPQLPLPLEAHPQYTKGTGHHTLSTNSSFSSDNSVLHAHRQNHNSSKLPAFRFADLKKDRISLPSLQLPAPLAPVLSQTTAEPRGASQTGLHHSSSAHTLSDRQVSFETKQTGGATRSRSLKFSIPSTSTTTTTTAKRSSADHSPPPKRPASDDVSAARSQLSSVATPTLKRRLTESAVKEPAQSQREFLLPNSVETATPDDKKSRPPLSYKPPNCASASSSASNASTSSARAVIPPIRSFRSSGSRKSVVLDMHPRRASEDLYREGTTDSNQRDRALRTLEGRRGDDFSHLAPSESGEMTTTTDNENTADIFMNIAREDPAPRAPEKQAVVAEPSTISRIVRAAHRRPQSTATPAHDASFSPQLSRRLSDQRENSRARQATDSQPTHQITREVSYRTTGREDLPPITTVAESSSRAQRSRTSSRPSPITPRQISFKDSFAESSSAYQRRRQSLTENNNPPSSRTTQYRNSNLAIAQARAYHSSPLVPKSANVLPDAPQHSSDTNHGVEGTESSSSTAAPSTVWDELDDLKSRIHRLERTGKAPATSAGAMSKSSSHLTPREAPPLLLSALSKTKDLVAPEVFSAIELAATDAMALSSMIGTVGQPGPISSSASTIGGYSGSLTDRQLRKKADSICRSLTELCLALADPTGQKKQPQPTTAVPEPEILVSPTASNNNTPPSVLTPQRRPSAVAEVIAKASTSPRAPTSLEQKRKTMLASISLPTSRFAMAPSTPLESTAGRKSSLLLARIRRTATEEPEEIPHAGRRSSLLLRSRRTGSEEPEENREGGRKTSLLLRTRKTMNEEEDESRFRVPSRAITEVYNFRAAAGAPTPNAGENNAGASSVLPRRRLIPSAIATRLASAVPSASAPTTPARKYLERSTFLERGTPQERGAINNLSERLAEERGQQQQRQTSQGQTAMLNRSGSLGRRSRDTGIPNFRS